MKKYQEAIDAYNQGLKIDPENVSLKEGIEEVRKQMNNSSSNANAANDGASDGMGNLFGNDMFNLPNMLNKLQNNPRTKQYLSDPSYIQMLNDLKQNPASILTKMSDPRVMDTIGALFGINKNGDHSKTDDDAADGSDPMNSRQSRGNYSTESKTSNKKEEKMDEDLPENRRLALLEKDSGMIIYRTFRILRLF